MKRMLFIISVFILSLVCLCGCASTKNSDLTDKIVDNYSAGITIVEKKINTNQHYQTTYIYLKVDGLYYYLENHIAATEVATGKYFYDVDINTYSNKKGTTCIELIQYANYFEITLGDYFSQDSNGRWILNTTEAGQLITKKLIISNNIGSYEIQNFR